MKEAGLSKVRSWAAMPSQQRVWLIPPESSGAWTGLQHMFPTGAKGQSLIPPNKYKLPPAKTLGKEALS